MRQRILSLLLILCMLLSACGHSAAAWQEQYDLGVRYLSEGNYEEAILAFEAAIEIDPKQADCYLGLAEAYIELGDPEKAAEVLTQALDRLGGNDSLQTKLDELEAHADPTEGREQFPEDYIAFEQWYLFRPYEELSQEEQAFAAQAMENLMSENAEAAFQMAEIPEKYLVTKIDDYFINIAIEGNHFRMQARQENGSAYYWKAGRSLEYGNEYYEYTVGTAAGRQWNGPFESYRYYQTMDQSGAINSRQESRTEGTMTQNLRHGPEKETVQDYTFDTGAPVLFSETIDVTEYENGHVLRITSQLRTEYTGWEWKEQDAALDAQILGSFEKFVVSSDEETESIYQTKLFW